ncbi:HEAT repeat domain-containing protein [Kiritimatiellaeota bacterium B1221]|nr:HEAT repeat domain-containing protein [Kiritimatiellaeota bacterium B1221]
MKGKLIAYLNDFEFKEGFQQMVNNPQAARAVIREEIGQWPDNTRAIRCLVVLAQVGEKDDALRVMPFLLSEDCQVRLKAILVMTTLGDDRILAAVEMSLYDTNDAVRSCAIGYLGELQTESAKAAFGRFLEFQPKTDTMRKDQERIRTMLKE